MSTLGDEFTNLLNSDAKSHPHTGLASGTPTAARCAISGFWLAAPAALMSGGAMMAAGYLLRAHGSGIAGLATIPGGVLIVVAFALASRGLQAPGAGTPPKSTLSKVRSALATMRNFGMPADLPLGPRVVALSLTVVAGAVMVLAGHIGAGPCWPWAAVLALIGGLLISGAFIVVAQVSR